MDVYRSTHMHGNEDKGWSKLGRYGPTYISVASSRNNFLDTKYQEIHKDPADIYEDNSSGGAKGVGDNLRP